MKNKARISGLALIIFCFTACKNNSLSKIFLIPLDYNGTLRVVYEDKSAAEPKRENGYLIFEFPKNGILILDKELDPIKSSDFYLLDNNGNKTSVTEILNAKDRLKKMPAVLAGVETVSGFTFYNSIPQVKGLVFIDYYLFNKDTTAIAKQSAQFDSLTNVVVAAFRAKK